MADQVIVRGLSDEEIPSWTEFCALCFSHKHPAPPAAYFRRHYDNDPYRRADMVRVAVAAGDDDHTEYRSTVRVFTRKVKGISGWTGGIGEVCTHPDQRRKGLASRLLLDAIEAMESSSSTTFLDSESEETCSKNYFGGSLLHVSNPSLREVYGKQGFTSIQSRWSVVEVNLDLMGEFPDTNRRWKVRPRDEAKDLARLQTLHATYSEARFRGCVVRSARYWADYVCGELAPEQMWVLTTRPDEGEDDDAAVAVAWMAVRFRNDKYELREFGVDHTVVTTSEAMAHLLLPCARACGNGNGTTSPFRLQLPTPVLDEVQKDETPSELVSSLHWNWNTIENADDYGWMYRPIQSPSASASVSADTILSDNHIPFLIWPTDSF